MMPRVTKYFGKAFSRLARSNPQRCVSTASGFGNCAFFRPPDLRNYLTVNSLVPTLEGIAKHFNIPAPVWSKTGFVFFQHFVDSFPDLVEALLKVGVPSENIIAAKKSYSECKHVTGRLKNLGVEVIPDVEQLIYGGYHFVVNQVTNRLWLRAIKKFDDNIEQVLAVDDGFYATSAVPPEMLNKPFVAVEQTSSGTTSLQSEIMPFPIVSFANTAIKKHLETEVIVEEMISSLQNNPVLKLPPDAVCGIVGYGSIGHGLAVALLQQGHKVLIYDKDPNKTIHAQKNGIFVAKKLSSLVSSVDFLFGCSGNDITESLEDFDDSIKGATLINFASSDQEFRSMLSKAQKQGNGKKNGNKNGKRIDVFALLEYRNSNGAKFLLPNGGFVANFNRSHEIAPLKRIGVTRTSLMGCIMQGMRFLADHKTLENPQRYMLDPRFQRALGIDWLQNQTPSEHQSQMLKNFSDLQWILRESSWIDPRETIDIFDESLSLNPSISKHT